MDTPDWVPQMFAAIDAMDADAFVSFLTDDACFRFGNAPAVTGRANIRDGVGGFFGTIKALRHRLSHTWAYADAAICEGEVTYTRNDGSEVTVPFANVLHLTDGRVSAYHIYIDLTPLYA